MELFIKLNKIKCCRFYFSCRLLNIAQDIKELLVFHTEKYHLVSLICDELVHIRIHFIQR